MDVNWGEIWGAVITVTIAGLIKYMFTFLKELKEKSAQEQKTKNNIIDALMKNGEELVEWRKYMEEKNSRIEQELQSINKQVSKITHSDLILMKDRILQICRYFLAKNYITMSARENLTDMYQCYQSLGGNGMGKLMYEQAMKLPIKDETVPEGAILIETKEENGGKSHGTNPINRKKKTKMVQQN